MFEYKNLVQEYLDEVKTAKLNMRSFMTFRARKTYYSAMSLSRYLASNENNTQIKNHEWLRSEIEQAHLLDPMIKTKISPESIIFQINEGLDSEEHFIIQLKKLIKEHSSRETGICIKVSNLNAIAPALFGHVKKMESTNQIAIRVGFSISKKKIWAREKELVINSLHMDGRRVILLSLLSLKPAVIYFSGTKRFQRTFLPYAEALELHSSVEFLFLSKTILSRHNL